MKQYLPPYAEMPLLPREWPQVEMDLPVTRKLEDTIRLLFYKYFGKESTDKWYRGIHVTNSLSSLEDLTIEVRVSTVSFVFRSRIFYVLSCFLDSHWDSLSESYRDFRIVKF